MQPTSKTRRGVHAALIVICLLMCLPALYALQSATLSVEQSAFTPPQLFPPGESLPDNIATLFSRLNFGQMLVNTTLVSLIVVISKTALALLAGMAFVYFRFAGKTVLFFIILFTLLMPTEIILLPLFNMMSQVGWGQNYPQLALTVPFLATATGTFLFRQHFSNIPREMAEAAQIDGATPLQFMLAVLIPMSLNVIAAHALIQFISSWNQYLWAALIISDSSAQVIQVGVRQAASLSTQIGSTTNYGVLMAAGIIASLPPLVLFILLQKQFMSGFALTKDK